VSDKQTATPGVMPGSQKPGSSWENHHFTSSVGIRSVWSNVNDRDYRNDSHSRAGGAVRLSGQLKREWRCGKLS
jgi:hypothetical protein